MGVTGFDRELRKQPEAGTFADMVDCLPVRNFKIL
jgi:hypothetical protein